MKGAIVLVVCILFSSVFWRHDQVDAQGYAAYGGSMPIGPSAGVSEQHAEGGTAKAYGNADGSKKAASPQAPLAPPRIPLPYDAMAEEADRLVQI